MNINITDNAIDLVAKFHYLLSETFFQMGELSETQEQFNLFNGLYENMVDTWEANKPSEYVYYEEWSDSQIILREGLLFSLFSSDAGNTASWYNQEKFHAI